jgi:predicted ATPase/DNA-binding SARP family transcriptional activator
MAHLSLAFLGPPQVTLGDRRIATFKYDKVLALLTYLVVEADTAHRRDSLAGLLWPDQTNRAARHCLSQALFTLRATLGDRESDPPLIRTTSTEIQFNTGCDYTLDVAEFTLLLAGCPEHHPHPAAICPQCAAGLEHAAALYRGDFLQHFQVPDSAPFEEWVVVQREHLHQRALEALTLLAPYHEQQGDLSRASAYLRRQIELEPWREEAHRQLMRMLAMSGERAAALKQYERCRQILADELGVEPDPETIALYKRIQAGDIRRQSDAVLTSPARSRSRSAARHLPRQSTPFVGRERELVELAKLLHDPSCRLVTLVGPGGIGKTRLALAAAEAFLSTSDYEVVFVQLAPLRAPELLVSAIADAVGLNYYGQDAPQEQLIDYLRGKSMLLVLDNFEHLLAATATMSELITTLPTIKILATSREQLNLHGEWVFEVEGLGIPTYENEEIEQYSAVQLFMQSARRARAHFSLQARDRTGMTRICRLVGGMPLGIELAAAWVAVLSLDEIAHEIERNLDFLTASTRDLPERHRSLRAVFEHSWQLLSEAERRAFRRLSIFQGGFTRAAAESVCFEIEDASLTHAMRLKRQLSSLELLASLTSASFLRRTSDGRYEIHELLRQYGESRLQDDEAEYRHTRDRHAQYYLQFLATREPHLKGHGQKAAAVAIAADLDNIRMACHWAAEQHTWRLIGPAINSLFIFFALIGRAQDADMLFSTIAAHAQHTPGDEEQEILLGRVLGARGGFLFRQGMYEHAAIVLNQSIAILRRHHEPFALALALNLLAATTHLLGRYDEERRMLHESIAHGHAAGDDWIVAYSLNDLGFCTHLLGNDNEAQRLCEESLAIFRRLHDRRGMAFTLNNLGVLAQQHGHYAEAERLYAECLRMRRDMGDQWGVATVLTQLGSTIGATGNVQRARICLLEALRRAREVRSLPAMLDGLIELAALAGCEGHAEQARTMIDACLSHPALSQSTRERAERLLAALHDEAFHVQRPMSVQSAEELVAELLADSKYLDSAVISGF